MKDEWIKDLSVEELPGSYQEIARIVGVENAVKLSEHLGGLPFYFPKIDGLLREKRDEAIRREFSGFNHRELARKYGLSEQSIRNIVRGQRQKNQEEFTF